jgi:uncharacterized membrane protein HdeD (DUF308 family)
LALTVSGAVALARWWWTFILRGVLAIVFGIVAFLVPQLGIAVLIGLFAAWALVDGVTSVFAGWRLRGSARSWWLQLLEGVVSIAAGVSALVLPPDVIASLLVVIIGAWSVVTGIFEIVMAVRLRQEIKGEFWLGLAGVASILFGIVLVLFPAAGALTLVWLIGSFAIAFGVLLVILGWRLRGIHELGKLDAARDYGR